MLSPIAVTLAALIAGHRPPPPPPVLRIQPVGRPANVRPWTPPQGPPPPERR